MRIRCPPNETSDNWEKNPSKVCRFSASKYLNRHCLVANTHAQSNEISIAHAQTIKMDFPYGFSKGCPSKNIKSKLQKRDQTW